ncbi:MAG: carboxypeptidase-like regulatory domain-containing protein, partial [Ignavibacteria bacterium]|nr:carboxypeptidase-like regulatory domain-containing protein [Ignavibacteria bacterium]
MTLGNKLMNKRIILLMLLPFVSLIGQTASLKGKVISDKAQPVIGANLILAGTSLGDASDLKGNFEIKNIPFGVYD